MMTNPVRFDDTTLRDLATRMGEAEKSRDAEFFEALLTEKLTFRRANGAVVDRTTFLRDLGNPENTYDLLESEDISAMVYERVAVVTLLVFLEKRGELFIGVKITDFANVGFAVYYSRAFQERENNLDSFLRQIGNLSQPLLGGAVC